ncbi:hypothetical protein GQ55_4G095900 [Panicum hallii var. hallii]|uniref:Uncharacterized protein n=1 Tax=Panicum hallii var. hallii TaxID=1504633 RepID=A0A2T7DWZ1_9POAL|nr:hypothetical protein GQ55_4G095900 [Panicum hallii var. hallii]
MLFLYTTVRRSCRVYVGMCRRIGRSVLHSTMYTSSDFEAAGGLHVPGELGRRRRALPGRALPGLLAEHVHGLVPAVAPGADHHHAPPGDGGDGRRGARVLGHLRHRPPRRARRGVARHEVPVAEHVQAPCRPRRRAAGPRARAVLEQAVPDGRPGRRRRVEGLRGADEPALRLRRVPAGDDELAADAEPSRLVALLRHVRERRPRVALRVVRQRRPQRVLLLVVAAGHVHGPADGRAGEEGSAGARHRRAVAPRAGQEVVDEHRVHRRPRLRVPPPDDHQPLPPLPGAAHGGHLAEQGQAPRWPGRRRQRRPPALRRVQQHHPVRVRGAPRGRRRRRVLLVRRRARVASCRRRAGLHQREHRARQPLGPAQAVVLRRLYLRLPLARDAAHHGQLVEAHPDEALPRHLLRQPRDQLAHCR